MWTMVAARLAGLALVTGVAGCSAPERGEPDDDVQRPPRVGPVEFRAIDGPAAPPVSVAAIDRPRRMALAGDGSLPVEARLLVLSADGSESALRAIRSVLDHRGVPHDLFVATAEPPLTASRLHDGDLGRYQATLLASSSLAIDGVSTLDAAEWAALADYEATFQVRRAVLAAWPDPALGFGPATQTNTSTTPLTVTCTTDGQAVFRDVRCDAPQQIRGGVAYLATLLDDAPLTPLLTDAAGHALAVVHDGGDGRASLLLLFGNHPDRLHSQLLLHGVLGWVTGGTYLGERRIEIGAQLDDLFLASNLWGGGVYRLDGDDLQAGLAWLHERRARDATPGFRVAFAYNGVGASAGDSLTEVVRATSADWHWIDHTFRHAGLDQLGYTATVEELVRNRQVATDLPLAGFDPRNLVTPGVSGLVNPEAMSAAADVGVRFAVTDTSRQGCDNPSPNTTFYNAVEPSILLVPRRPTNLFYNVSTPQEWVDEYNFLHRAHWGRDSTYAQVLDQESEVLLHYLLRGDADPWMFHQANLRAYDGARSLLGDLLDVTTAKLEARSRVPIRTPPMHDTGERFARRLAYEGAGVRATLHRGRAVVVDVARPASVPVTGVRAGDGEPYGGDVIARIEAIPGSTACVPLDDAGEGCSPAPLREGGPGPSSDPPLGACDASSIPGPIDAGPGQADATTPPDSPPIGDAAAAPPDAAHAPPDADAPPPDADAPPPDADAPPPDAAHAPPDAAHAPPDAAEDGHDAADGVLPDAAPAPGGGGAAGAGDGCAGCSTGSRGAPTTALISLIVAGGLLIRRRGRRGSRPRGHAGALERAPSIDLVGNADGDSGSPRRARGAPCRGERQRPAVTASAS
jgi:hypothetical protein